MAEYKEHAWLASLRGISDCIVGSLVRVLVVANLQLRSNYISAKEG